MFQPIWKKQTNVLSYVCFGIWAHVPEDARSIDLWFDELSCSFRLLEPKKKLAYSPLAACTPSLTVTGIEPTCHKTTEMRGFSPSVSSLSLSSWSPQFAPCLALLICKQTRSQQKGLFPIYFPSPWDSSLHILHPDLVWTATGSTGFWYEHRYFET